MSAEIDWNDQWQHHAHAFFEGKAHIPLASGKKFFLEPGPGFGDYSHPTTQLVMEMLPPSVNNQNVFDIGCGSGILSIAAYLSGARSVAICDIDPDAVAHAQHNAALNGVQLKVGKPTHNNVVVLMNMIASEQKQAWSENQLPFSLLITSGILASERESYLDEALSRNWILENECEKEGWLAFAFKEKQK